MTIRGGSLYVQSELSDATTDEAHLEALGWSGAPRALFLREGRAPPALQETPLPKGANGEFSGLRLTRDWVARAVGARLSWGPSRGGHTSRVASSRTTIQDAEFLSCSSEMPKELQGDQRLLPILLNALSILLVSELMALTAASASREATRAYSIRSCPASSFQRLVRSRLVFMRVISPSAIV